MDRKGCFLQMASMEGMGNVAIKKIIDSFTDIKKIFKADANEISEVSGLSREKARKIISIKNRRDVNILKELEEIENKGLNLYFYGDNNYPKLLSEIHDPPIVLYCDGKIKDTDYNAVAIVGTRRCSEYGIRAARMIARMLAANNITVISGCAVGIDTAAHKGAIEGGGRTIAVLGSGLNEKYPRENIRLMKKISENGAVVSEFHLNTIPASYNFPLRNRIISGLSLGVVVVEAPYRSGALITAYHALEQGREVYAIPSGIFSLKSKGCLDLIKRGAILVTDPEEIIKDIAPMLDKTLIVSREEEFEIKNLSKIGKKILHILSNESLHIDTISAETKIDVNILGRELTTLEMMGRIKQVKGKRYIRN